MSIYRRIIVLVLVLSMTVLFNAMYRESMNNGEELFVEAFHNTSFDIEKAELHLWGSYGYQFLTALEIERMIKNIADELGLKDYHVESDEFEEEIRVTIDQEAKEANVHIEWIEKVEEVGDRTFRAENYLLVNLVLLDKYNSIGYFEDKLTKTYKNLYIKPTKSVAITASKEGRLEDNHQEILRGLFDSLDGEVLAMIDEEDLSSAYGYSKRMENYVLVKGEKINLDLAITYNEVEDRTYFYGAVPAITFEY